MSALDAAIARLHPQVAALLEGPAGAPLDAAAPDLEALRRGYAQTAERLGGPKEDVAHAQDLRVPTGDADGREIPVRYYLPVDEADAPPGVVVWLHGGGWILGDLAGIDGACRAICVESGHAVLSVDYRLAPEHPFPAGVDDAWHVLDWVSGPAGAEMLAIEEGRVVVGGDSAGGNLAAVLARRARDAGLRVRGQVLVYPALDPARAGASHAEFADGPFLTAADMDQCWTLYAGGDPDALAGDPDFAPVAADSLAGLPPTHVALAEIDPLRDDGAAYARALADAGVPVTMDVHEGMAHGFLRWAGVADEARTLLARVGAAARAQLS